MRFQMYDDGSITAMTPVVHKVEPLWVVHTIAWMLAEKINPTEPAITEAVVNHLRSGGIERMARFPQGWTKKIKNAHEEEARVIFAKHWPGVPV